MPQKVEVTSPQKNVALEKGTTIDPSLTQPKKKTESELRHEIRKATAEMHGILNGKKTTIEDIRKEKVSEEKLFATMVLRRMNNRTPEVSKHIAAELGAQIVDAKAKGAPKPIATALVSVLESAVAKNLMTKSEMESAVGFALGKAQLDPREGGSGTGSIDTVVHDNITDANGHSRENSLESVVTRVRSNSRLSPELARLFIDSSALHTIGTNPLPQAPSNGTLPIVRDPKFGSVWHDGEKTITGPLCFHYLPPASGASTGELLVPSDLASQYNSVSFYNETTQALTDLVLAERMRDGRARWTIDRASVDSENSGTFVLSDRTGSSIHYSVGNLKREAFTERE